MSRIGYIIGFLILSALCAYLVYFAEQLVSLARSGAFDGAFLRLMDLGAVLGTVLLFWMTLFGGKVKKK